MPKRKSAPAAANAPSTADEVAHFGVFSLKKAKTKDKQKPAAIGASKFQAVPFPKQERPREAECRVRHQIGSRQLKFKN